MTVSQYSLSAIVVDLFPVLQLPVLLDTYLNKIVMDYSAEPVEDWVPILPRPQETLEYTFVGNHSTYPVRYPILIDLIPNCLTTFFHLII